MHVLKTSRLTGSEVKLAEGNEYLQRFHLLPYRDVARLRDIMETTVPIHGAGNFPTLQIKPSQLVQLVRDRIEAIGIKVHDIRLNGSAATHVLSGNMAHTYKDLDLIFTIDFPSATQFDDTFSMRKRGRHKVNEKYRSSSSALQRSEERTENLPVEARPSSLPKEVRRLPSPLLEKEHLNDDFFAVDDSGYTSSGSSATSAPVSPSCSVAPLFFGKSMQKCFRSRTRSLESMSSTSSVPPFSASKPSHDVSPESIPQTFLPHHQSWQEIKDATMEILLDFLPENMSRSRMDSAVFGSAYVQKMVKVTNASDEWSLISLNNNSGRNLELKFVQSMKRQYEFSVDSFQIILDTYLGFREATEEAGSDVAMSDSFHPTVLAESVYGDCATALRHLRNRRICTHRPEEIRGGGLLRYCNLIVRNFIPGDCDEGAGSFGAKNHLTTSDPHEVAKLEQHMCSRFFIDFNDIDRQRRKLLNYLDNHFAGEDDLKFQYLLVLRRVVDASTVCLMSHERTMILNLITMLIRQTLVQNVAKNSADPATKFSQSHVAPCTGTAYPSSGDEMQSQYRGTYRVNTFYQSLAPYSGCSSPLSTYSTCSAPIEGERATPSSLTPHSLSQTPVPSYYDPYTLCNTQTNFQDSYYGGLPTCGEMLPYCACCGHYFGQVYNPHPAVPQLPSSQDQFTSNTMQPITCDFDKIKCFYTPVGYNAQADA